MEAKINASKGILSVPVSTYRIQFHKGFSMSQALDLSLAEYLKHLGAAYLYSSPLLKVLKYPLLSLFLSYILKFSFF